MTEPTESKNKKALMPLVISLLAVALLIGLSLGAGLFKNKDAPVPAPATAVVDEHAPVVAAPEPAPAAVETAPVVAETADVNSFKAARMIGSPDAPVKIVEYASLTCHHCSDFHKNVLPQLREKYIDKGLVSLEFVEFPLNGAALDAAILARCLPADKYDGYTSLLFKTQDDWTTKPDYITTLKQNAKLAGLSEEQANACLQSQDAKNFIANNVKDATKKWDVASTPTFVVNGKEKISGGMPLYEFERIFRVVSDGKVGALEKPAEGTITQQ